MSSVVCMLCLCSVTSGGEEEESAAEDNSRKEKTFAWNVCSSVEVFPECIVGSHLCIYFSSGDCVSTTLVLMVLPRHLR